MANLKVENLCPVCGFEMDDPPENYNICPSCGTEFGLHDANASIQDLRACWIKRGPTWWSTTDQRPKDWNPFEQLARVLTSSAAVSGGGVFVVTTASSSDFIPQPWASTVAAHVDTELSTEPELQPAH